MTLAGGICAALLKRERTGETSVVDGSLLGTAIWFNGLAIVMPGVMAPPSAPAAGTDYPPPPPGRAAAPAGSKSYRTQDNRFLNLLFLGDADRDWIDLWVHLDRPDLTTDPRFADSPSRTTNAAEATAILDDIFASKPLEEWKRILVTAKGAWAPVQKVSEIFDDPQTVANGYLREVEYPGGGNVTVPVPPILFDEDGGDPPPAPDFGEHTDEVLHELGFDTGQIDQLRADGAIR